MSTDTPRLKITNIYQYFLTNFGKDDVVYHVMVIMVIYLNMWEQGGVSTVYMFVNKYTDSCKNSLVSHVT